MAQGNRRRKDTPLFGCLMPHRYDERAYVDLAAAFIVMPTLDAKPGPATVTVGTPAHSASAPVLCIVYVVESNMRSMTAIRSLCVDKGAWSMVMKRCGATPRAATSRRRVAAWLGRLQTTMSTQRMHARSTFAQMSSRYGYTRVMCPTKPRCTSFLSMVLW